MGKPSASRVVALSQPLPLGLHVLGAVLFSSRLLHCLWGPTLSAYSGLFCSSVILARMRLTPTLFLLSLSLSFTLLTG